MKDTIITSKRKKTEILIWLFCFLIANILNIYSIISYKTEWSEIYTSIIYVFLFACFLYFFLGMIRIIYYLIKKVIAQIKN